MDRSLASSSVSSLSGFNSFLSSNKKKNTENPRPPARINRDIWEITSANQESSNYPDSNSKVEASYNSKLSQSHVGFFSQLESETMPAKARNRSNRKKPKKNSSPVHELISEDLNSSLQDFQDMGRDKLIFDKSFLKVKNTKNEDQRDERTKFELSIDRLSIPKTPPSKRPSKNQSRPMAPKIPFEISDSSQDSQNSMIINQVAAPKRYIFPNAKKMSKQEEKPSNFHQKLRDQYPIPNKNQPLEKGKTKKSSKESIESKQSITSIESIESMRSIQQKEGRDNPKNTKNNHKQAAKPLVVDEFDKMIPINLMNQRNNTKNSKPTKYQKISPDNKDSARFLFEREGEKGRPKQVSQSSEQSFFEKPKTQDGFYALIREYLHLQDQSHKYDLSQYKTEMKEMQMRIIKKYNQEVEYIRWATIEMRRIAEEAEASRIQGMKEIKDLNLVSHHYDLIIAGLEESVESNRSLL